MGRRVLVSGGNSGIGLAVVRQLVHDHRCHVYLCSRSTDKGQQAVKEVLNAKPANCQGTCELVQLDVTDGASVSAAAAQVKSLLGSASLYAVVNNAGAGLKHGVDPATIVQTNFFGPKRVCEAFLPLIDPSEGRIVNVGSGAGPGYVKRCEPKDQKVLCNPSISWAEIESQLESGLGSPADTMNGYGISKALLTCYTMLLAREQPHLKISCVSPGFIDTKMTIGYGATKTTDEGTVAIKHCLFEVLEGNGWYYGSDAVRSPLHFMRNPGEPAYDGTNPFVLQLP